MQEGVQGVDDFAAIIDVRQFASRVKHQTIFAVWGALSPGSKMLLVNDHDPKPLYYQLDAEYSQQFEWTYLEAGPERWQVEIQKTVVPPADRTTNR
ncbi:DUF2249 domain-containing protein [Alicyclobacillus cycloheptanicus]|nr:DUF2249 domain-containing protein [Alicyclobacillus cycloheptanicus]